jgi:hypothetical protein
MRNLKAILIYAASAVCLAAAVAMPAAGSTTYKITSVSGNSQTQTVGTTLANPFVVQVTDSNNNPVAGMVINWSVMSGGGSLATSSSTTDSTGQTSNVLTLGTAMGNNKAVATVAATGANALFGAVGTPGAAVAIGPSSGNNQSGTVGTALPNSLAAIITDQYGNPALNTEVDWAVLSGGGSINYAYSLSKSGIATKALTLGAKPGTNTVSATIKGTSLSYIFTETGTPGTLPVGPPANIAVSSGAGQTQTVGTALSSPFVVLVTDSNGTPVPNATVTWSVMSGGGSLASTSTTTNSSGQTSDTLTLGTVTGNNKVFATISNGSNALFGAVGNPGTAVAIGLSSGNGQSGTVGAPLSNLLAVVVTDQYGNAAQSIEVDWTVLSGGGSVPYAYSLSNGGIATKALTLGTTPGANTTVATVHGMSLSYTFSETAVPGPVASLAVSSGNDQVGNGAGALSAPLTVVAADQYGNPLTGIKVDWTANTSGDSFSVASSITNSSGLASSVLTLGSAFGLHTATANVDGTNIQQGFVATEDVDAVVTAQLPTTPQTIPNNFMGLSYQKSWISTRFPTTTNSALLALLKKLGPGVLRIVAEAPFGSSEWNPNGPGLVYGTVAPPDLARLAAVLKAANWQILYGIQLVNNTPANAASEAAVAAQEFGSSLLGFEIGNEPDQYANAVYGNPVEPQLAGYTWADYISTTPVYDSNGNLLPSWPAFASAIESAAPNAPLTGPTGTFSWAINFAGTSQASEISLLTRHYYALPPLMSPPPTVSQLLTPDPRVATQFPQLAQAAAGANIPGGYRISECNSVAGASVPGVTNSFGAALWTIDFLFQNAVYSSSGVNFNGGGSDQTSYSPIYDDGTNVTGIGPDYYGLLAAYSLLRPGAKLMTTQVTPAPTTFSAYAVQRTNGTTWFILSNKDPNNDITVSVTRPGSSTAANSLLLTAPSLTATSGIQLGGSSVGINGSWSAASNPSLNMVGTSAVVTIPAGSAQIVQLY